MTFLELAKAVLEERVWPLTAGEIWAEGIKKKYDKQLNSKGATPWATLGSLIYVSSKDNPKSDFARTTDTSPKYFYLKSQEDKIDFKLFYLQIEANSVQKQLEKELQSKTPGPRKPVLLEKELHRHLSNYAYYYLHSHTKTINHATSAKKEFGEWVHPDVVGCYFPFDDDWKEEVYDLSSAINDTAVRLSSFELKRKLSFANLRESFFQTVSNSSWANEAYLVAAEIATDEDFRNELSRLSTSFGIGVIQLDLEDVHSSAIIYPARYRDRVDWEMINKLAMNADFKEFITNVKIDLNSKKVHFKEYNEIDKPDKVK